MQEVISKDRGMVSDTSIIKEINNTDMQLNNEEPNYCFPIKPWSYQFLENLRRKREATPS